MSVLRAHWVVTAASVMAAGTAFAFIGGSTNAAQVIQIPESEQAAPLAAEETTAAEQIPSGPRIEVAQFPPPPFYIDQRPPGPAPRWTWPWERDDRSYARPEAGVPQNQLNPRKRRNVAQDPNAQERQQREPSFALTRNMRGSYKDKIASLLDQPQSFPQPNGPLLLVVSITKQTVTVYDGGVQFAKSPVSTGTFERPTPLGVFNVLEKQWWHRSNMYSAAPMPFMQRITWDGVALHAGELPGYRASHGCVRLPESFAYRLWYTSNVGARVVITWNDPVPADISHPLLFQPAPAPKPTPEPAKPPQISPREIDNAPVSAMYRPPLGDELDRLRDSMMTAAVDAGESTATEAAADEEEHSPLQPAIAFLRLDGSDMLEAQPVLDMLSARSKTKRSRLSRVYVPEYEPESVLRPGPVSVFISRHDSRIYVRKGMQPVFNMPVTIANQSESMGTHVFTAASAGNDGKLRWMVVSPTGNEVSEERVTRRRGRAAAAETAATPVNIRAATAALDRIGLPQAAIDRIDDLVSVGATLIISDAGAGRTAAVPDTDFSIVLR